MDLAALLVPWLARRAASVTSTARLFRTSALAAAALAALASSGCATREDDLHGMELDLHTRLAWGEDPALRHRVQLVLDAACDELRLDPSLLYGMTLRIEDDGIACGDVSGARGCTWRGEGTVSVSTLSWMAGRPPVPCVEDTPIPHELLHVLIGDPNHTDPRWTDPALWRPIAARIEQPDCSGDPPNLTW
ncbi:MAG TPA: hypothetical protein VF875_12610 [Anaeromyxobacter sp.]